MMTDKEPTAMAGELAEAVAAEEDYLSVYREWFERFAASVQPEDQLPVYVAGYRVTEPELRGEVLAWSSQYLASKRCPSTLQTLLCRIILEEVPPAAHKSPHDFGYDPDDSVYIPLKLMQATIERVNAICLRYLDNAALDALPPPRAPPAPPAPLSVSGALKNSRRVMEDRHVEIADLDALFGVQCAERTSVFAVYDGHVSSAAATYCAAHLHQYLCESAHYATDLRRALHDAFLRTDTQFIHKSAEKRAGGGSTAVVVAIRGRRLVAGWVGDSQALLVKGCRFMSLVLPHRPDRQDERERITALGGQVLFWGTWRVNGQLAVSRAIGDAKYKPYVTGEPELTEVQLDGEEDFVVIASDGLWDVLGEQEVMLLVYSELLAAKHHDWRVVPQRLIVRAKCEGSGDNISVIVVFLRDPRHIRRDCKRMGPGVLSGGGRENGTMSGEASETAAGDAAAAAGKRPGWAEGALGDAFHHLLDDAADPFLPPLCGAGVAVASNGGGVGAAAAAGATEEMSEESESEDLGPETAVDGAEELEAEDADAEIQRMQARECEPPAERAGRDTPTPPAHHVHESRAAPAPPENVAESGDDSEDEWNYFKGENKQRESQSTPPHSPLPHSPLPHSPLPHSPLHHHQSPVSREGEREGAWEVDEDSSEMNSSPLNPEAPVFVPTGAESPLGGALLAERVIAESPRKPLSMDDVELPASERHFESEATERPADLLLDDLLNGHHVRTSEKLELNGNGKLQLEELAPEHLLQDLQRVQRDTTHFCNIQVGLVDTASEVAEVVDAALLERLQSKERDPMSMSFYGERVDLNAVQPLPDSDEELDTPSSDKENLYGYDDAAFRAAAPPAAAPPAAAAAAATDTPESHKLLFEQIPETPHGKPESPAAQHNPFLDDLLGGDTAADFGENVLETKDHDLIEEFIPPRDEPERLVPEQNGDFTDRADVEQNLETFHVNESQFEKELERRNDSMGDDLINCDIQIHLDPTEAVENVQFEEHSPAPSPQPDLSSPSPQPDLSSPSPQPERDVSSPQPALGSPSPQPELGAPSPQPERVVSSPQPALGSPSPQPELGAPSPQPERDGSSPLPERVGPSPQPELDAPSPQPERGAISPAPTPSTQPRHLLEDFAPEPQFDDTELTIERAARSPDSLVAEAQPEVLAQAQEICIPVTSEIVRGAATPPPTPATALDTPPDYLQHSEVLDTPIAADATHTNHEVLADLQPELLAEHEPELLAPVESESTFDLTSQIEPAQIVPDVPTKVEPEITRQIESEVHSQIETTKSEFESHVEQLLTRVEPEIVEQESSRHFEPEVHSEIEPEVPAHVEDKEPSQDKLEVTSQIEPLQPKLELSVSPTTNSTQPESEVPAQSELVNLAEASAGAAAAVAVAATAAVVAASKSKTPASTKKPTTAAKTPASPTKSATKTPVSKTSTTTLKKTPTSTATPLASAGKAAAPKVSPTKTTATKLTATPSPKPPTPAARPAAAARPAPAAKPAPAARAPAARPAPAKSAPTSARSAPAPRAAAPAASAAARPAPARAPAARPATAGAAAKPKPAATKTEVKPLTNGEARPPIRRPVPGAVPPAKPPAAAVAPKPAPRPAAAAPRPAAPRAAAPRPTAATTAATQAKAPAARAPAARPGPGAAPALDKTSKDLANRRLSGKAAPPRSTATTKGYAKPTAVKMPNKTAPAPAAEPALDKQPLTNGSGEHGPAASPAAAPAPDAAQLPDVVA